MALFVHVIVGWEASFYLLRRKKQSSVLGFAAPNMSIFLAANMPNDIEFWKSDLASE